MKIDDKLLMAYPHKMVEAIILGLVDPLNQHLVKLVGSEFPAELRRHFRKGASSWLNKIQRLRMKPTKRTGSFRFYFNTSPEEVVIWLKQFHAELARRLHDGETVLDMVLE